MSDTHGPIVPEFCVFMNELAHTLDELLNGDNQPKENGFALFMLIALWNGANFAA